jgi:hypothetical protein
METPPGGRRHAESKAQAKLEMRRFGAAAAGARLSRVTPDTDARWNLARVAGDRPISDSRQKPKSNWRLPAVCSGWTAMRVPQI